MPRTIAIVNQKGGVGKTTTAINVSAYLATLGKKVLVVDLDPQANASSGFGIDHASVGEGMYEVMTTNGGVKMRDVLKLTTIDGLHLAPSTPNLAGANIELVEEARREFRLEDCLKEIESFYDYIIIDCPPTLGLLTINGIVAAREILVPVQCEYYALEGLGQLLHTIYLVQKHLQPKVGILGAVLTMYDGRNKLSEAVFEELKNHFPDRIFSSVVPRNVKLAEAPSFGKPISLYDASSRGAAAYEALAKEIIAMEKNET